MVDAGGVDFFPCLFYLVVFPHLDVSLIGALSDSRHPCGGKRKYSTPLVDSPPRYRI